MGGAGDDVDVLLAQRVGHVAQVEQATGRVVKTQFNIGKRGTGIEVATTFRTDPELQIDVPVQLKEWYPDGQGGDITGEATYGRFRRFQVTTEEDLKK